MAKVLIVEDDMIIADFIEESLVDAGYEVCGVARTVAEALALGLAHGPDLAVIDMRLAEGGLGTDVAAGLRRNARVGVLFATGNVQQVSLNGGDGEGYIAKPFTFEGVSAALGAVQRIMAGGAEAAAPLPLGFHRL